VTRIDLRQVFKCFPGQPHPAVDNVSIAVSSGSLLALLGPSGSGKSTLLKLIAGVETPDQGAICIDGVDIQRVPAHRRGAVLMFQKAYLFPFLSVADNIAFGLKMQGASRATRQAAVRRMLDLVELPGIERKQPGQLSGGEQQRVALARALVIEPRVLLLDEPFSSLDPAVRQTLQEAVRRIQRELGTTTILVTHDRSEALAMADAVALLERGQLIAHDTPQRLYTRPPNERAARQMGVTTFLRGELAGATLHSQFGPLAISEQELQTRNRRREDAAQCVGKTQQCSKAVYAIRPEHLCVLAQAAPNSVAATMIAQVFRGDHIEYQLKLADEILRVHAAQPVSGDTDQVYVQFPPEHLFALV
jgi:ABC-type Fe3+/spermidine/putrescine transport system ATPase subunit